MINVHGNERGRATPSKQPTETRTRRSMAMKITLADHDQDADYIRHARRETLRALRIPATELMLGTAPFSKCVLAHYENGSHPIGMGESALLSDAYGRYENAPYAHVCDLKKYGPLNQIAGMRTVFAEPDHRQKNSLFLALTFGSAKLFYGLGARFATASTRAADQYLNSLYAKLGEHVGTFYNDQLGEPASLYVFDLTKTLNHRIMRRISRYVTFEFGEPCS